MPVFEALPPPEPPNLVAPILLGLLASAAALGLGWRRRHPPKVERPPAASPPPLRAHQGTPLLLRPPEAAALRGDLSIRLPDRPSRHLDAARSADATARANGLPRLIFHPLRVAASASLWIDRSASHPQLDRLCAELIAVSAEAGCPLTVYDVVRTPDLLYTAAGPLRLADLPAAIARAPIAFLTDGVGLLDAVHSDPTGQRTAAMLRHLRDLPQLSFIDLGGPDPLAALLARHKLRSLPLEQAFAAFGPPNALPRSPRRATPPDLARWAGLLALSPRPVSATLALRLRQSLALNVAPWWIDVLAEEGALALDPAERTQSLRRLWRALGLDRAPLTLQEDTVVREPSPLTRAIAFFDESLQTEARSPDRHRRRSPATEQALRRDRALLALFLTPGTAIEELRALAQDGAAAALASTLGDWTAWTPNPPKGALMLPWRLQDLHPLRQRQLTDLGLGANFSLPPAERPLPYAELALAAAALLAFGVAGWRHSQAPTPTVRAEATLEPAWWDCEGTSCTAATRTAILAFPSEAGQLRWEEQEIDCLQHLPGGDLFTCAWGEAPEHRAPTDLAFVWIQSHDEDALKLAASLLVDGSVDAVLLGPAASLDWEALVPKDDTWGTTQQLVVPSSADFISLIGALARLEAPTLASEVDGFGGLEGAESFVFAGQPVTCGNGLRDTGEDCDGEPWCDTRCESLPIVSPILVSVPRLGKAPLPLPLSEPLCIGDRVRIYAGGLLRTGELSLRVDGAPSGDPIPLTAPLTQGPVAIGATFAAKAPNTTLTLTWRQNGEEQQLQKPLAARDCTQPFCELPNLGVQQARCFVDLAHTQVELSLIANGPLPADTSLSQAWTQPARPRQPLTLQEPLGTALIRDQGPGGTHTEVRGALRVTGCPSRESVRLPWVASCAPTPPCQLPTMTIKAASCSPNADYGDIELAVDIQGPRPADLAFAVHWTRPEQADTLVTLVDTGDKSVLRGAAPPCDGAPVEGLLRVTGCSDKARDELPFVSTRPLRWVTVRAGEGQIGDEKEGGPYEKPELRVKFDAFRMLDTEVTNAQYALHQPDHRYAAADANRPVVNVDWNQAKAWCEKQGGRLPTELEWEYAARAGGSGSYGLGKDGVDVDETNLGDFAWNDGNAQQEAHNVATRRPNDWGLYDLWGNVWEWTLDGYSADSYQQIRDLALAAKGARNDKNDTLVITNPGFVDTFDNQPPDLRVLRGGSAWLSRFLRSGFRDWRTPSYSDEKLGFRCVRAPARHPLNLTR